MTHVRALLADPTDQGIREAFSPEFLKSIPPDKVKAVFNDAKSGLGACSDQTIDKLAGNTKAVLTLKCEKGNMSVTIAVDEAAPHLIEGLLLKPE